MPLRQGTTGFSRRNQVSARPPIRNGRGFPRRLPRRPQCQADATATADAIGIRIIRSAVLPERRASARPLNAYRRTVTSDETSVHDAGDRE